MVIKRIAQIVLFAVIASMLAATPMPAIADEQRESGLTPGTGDAGTDAFVVPPTGYVVIYFFPGARTITNTIATSVHCSNLLGATTGVIVEFYDFNGVRVGFSSYNLNQYGSVTTSANSTGSTTLYFDDKPVALTSELDQGLVRVLKKGTGRIVCTAQVLDAINLPPVFVLPLTHFGATGLH